MKKVAIFIVFLLVISISFFLYYKEGSLPVNKESNKSTIFVIKKGSTVNEIIIDLDNNELIRNKIVFFFIVKQLGIENSIQAGTFRLSPSMSAKEIAQSLTKGTLDIWVTVIEGLRKEEIAQIFSQELGIPETEFIEQAQEGTLFPDTYLIPQHASISTILQIFKTNFDKKYSADLRQKAAVKGLTDNEVLTLASMVEREANSEESMREVASIIYKRYKNDWPLQIDATVQYILGYQEGEKTWWKQNLTSSDLEIESLYNTYVHPGIPPAPIASPGLSAIKAVIDADENTPYWFYISNKDGSKMLYSKTLEEHNANVRKYLK